MGECGNDRVVDVDRPDLGTAKIIRADARHLPIDDDSVDLIVTSPPYFALRSYQDGGEHYEGQIGSEPTPTEFVDALLEVTRECVRVLKPSGSLWVNLGDKYAGSRMDGSSDNGGAASTIGANQVRDEKVRRGQGAVRAAGGVRSKSLIGIPWRYALRCVDELGLILRAEVIWAKPNGLPESVTDRVRRAHEQWFHLTLEPRYFSAVDEIREQYAPETAARYAYGFKPAAVVVAGQSANGPARADGGGPGATNPLGKLPGSVWTVPTEPLRVPDHLGIDHFAAFPTEWPKRIIQGWSPTHGVVLDPFGGTGTTAMVAKALGRQGISVDMSADYCRLAQWRTNDRDQLAKVLGIAKNDGPTQDESLLDLLDGGAA